MFSINTDVATAVALANLGNAGYRLQRTQEDVSTGLKVNNPADDASDFAIAQGTRADLLGRQALSEVQAQAKGVLSVTNAATTDVSNILTRMKTLAVQATSGANNSTQLADLQQEFAALTNQIDTTVQGATYNGTNLLYAVPPGPAVTQTANFNVTDTLAQGKVQAGDAVSISFTAQNTSGSQATDAYTATAVLTRTDTLAGGGTVTTTVGTQTIAPQAIAANSSASVSFADTVPAGVTASTYQMTVTSTNGYGTINGTTQTFSSTSPTYTVGTPFTVAGFTTINSSATINGPPTGGAAVFDNTGVIVTDTLAQGKIQAGDSASAFLDLENIVSTNAATGPVSATLNGTQSVDGGAPAALPTATIPAQTIPGPALNLIGTSISTVSTVPAAASTVNYDLTSATTYNGGTTTLNDNATFNIGAAFAVPGHSPSSTSNTFSEVVQPLPVTNSTDGTSTLQINRSNLTSSNLGLSGLNLTTNAHAALTAVNAAMTTVGTTAGYYGEQSQQLDGLDTFYQAIQDAVQTGLGATVDANMATEAAKLQAEQMRQQLSAQTLPVANSQFSVISELFRNGSGAA